MTPWLQDREELAAIWNLLRDMQNDIRVLQEAVFDPDRSQQ